MGFNTDHFYICKPNCLHLTGPVVHVAHSHPKSSISGDSAGPHSLTQNLRNSAPEALLSNVTAAHGFMSTQKKYF